MLIGAQAPSEGVVVREAGLRIGYVPTARHRSGHAADRGSVARLSGTSNKEKYLQIAERVWDIRPAAAADGVAFWWRVSAGLLAQSLLVRPDLLVLDEPTQGLDQPGVASFYRLIEDVPGENLDCAVLMVSPDLHVVMRFSDHVICLNGHVCCQGTPTLVSAAPEYQALFGFGTEGALALYRHDHDHRHDHSEGASSDAG
ncbi:MAG: zinc import ATP-binding protein ZnuC [Pseudomonadota bacterium]|nr:MAG: zinc import ATP-binding protein ZnuC [Pseudomonadota bacterium]